MPGMEGLSVGRGLQRRVVESCRGDSGSSMDRERSGDPGGWKRLTGLGVGRPQFLGLLWIVFYCKKQFTSRVISAVIEKLWATSCPYGQALTRFYFGNMNILDRYAARQAPPAPFAAAWDGMCCLRMRLPACREILVMAGLALAAPEEGRTRPPVPYDKRLAHAAPAATAAKS